MPEAATRDVLQEGVSLEILQNSQENTYARVSFLIKLQASRFFRTLPGDCFTNVLEGVYTWNFIPGWNRPRMKSFLSMVKCLLLFTHFFQDEISSRDERQGWDLILGWKKEKKTCKHFIPGRNFKMSMFLINFWRMYSNMLSKVNVFQHNKSMNVVKHKASL